MKHEKKHSSYSRHADLDGDIFAPALQDQPEFQRHAQLFSKVVRQAKQPLCIREIRATMGDEFRERWFDLTVIFNSDTIEEVKGNITRWTKRTKKRLDVPAGNY